MADGQFDLGLVMRADGSQAVAAGDQLADSLDKVSAANKRVGASSREAASGADAEAAANKRGAAAATEHSSTIEKLIASNSGLARSQKASTAAHNDNTAAMNRSAFGARSLGQQVGDFATQLSLGGSVVQAFSAQVGQAGFAASEMGGKIGAVGRFLVGPWGVALTVGALVLAPFIDKLAQAALGGDKLTDALDKAGFSTSAFKDAQSTLGSVLDLNTGKINTQSSALLGLARAQAVAGQIQARARAAEARSELAKGRNDSGLSFAAVASGARNRTGGSFAAGGQDGTITSRSDTANIANDVLLGRTNTNDAIRRLDGLLAKGKITERQFLDLGKTITTLGVEGENLNVYKNLEKALDGDTKAVKGFLNEAKVRKPKAAPKPKSTEARDEFGRDAATTIDGVLARFDNTPSLVRQTNAEVAKLDDLIDDLGRKKPPGFRDLIADAERAKVVVKEGLNKPFDDFIAAQNDALANSRLLAKGRGDEAEAAKIILGLEKQIGPLTPERKDAVLATVQALKAEERQLDILREKQQRYLTALGEIKDTIKGAVTGGIDGILDVPKRLLASFTKLQGEQLFESLFGGVFRDLEDQIKGTTVVEDASARMSEAVDKASASILRLGDAAASVTGAGAGSVVTSGGLSGVSALANAIPGVSAGALGALFSAAGGGGSFGGGASNDNGDEIVVNGRREKSATSLFSTAIGKVTEKLAGIFTDPEKAKGIGTAIGGVAGKGLAGAATGALANSFLKPLGNALGFKTSSTGASLGGAAGGIVGSITGIPGLDVAGGILGSLVGGLFKKTKVGKVTLTGVDSQLNASGNSSAAKDAAESLGGSVQSGLQQIADQLGGSVGGFNVTVGTRHGDYRVTSGTSLKKKNGALDFDDDADAANAAAIQLAITQGAIKGLSAAMQKALQSSTDIDAALKEALKVQSIELLIGGVGAQLEKTFRDFDTQAADYVATAKKYGLDVLAVEKETAKQRTDLIETTLKNQVGGLQDFLTSLASGDLFEGSAADKRNALLAQIATTETDAKAGKEGAADQLADLYRNLIEGTRKDFGTAGPELAADRALGQSGAAAIIASEKERITQAANQQQAVVDAATKGNELTNETNDLLAVQNVKLDNMAATLRAALGYGPATGSASLERAVSLAA